MRIGIVGCSRVGCSFANAVSSKLKNVSIILCKVTAKKVPEHKNNLIRYSYSIEDTISSSDIIFIAVKDDKISYIVQKITRMCIDINEKYFLHFSGSITSDVFLPLKRLWMIKGASAHPVASFPSVEVGTQRMFNIWWVFEGDKEVLKKIKLVIKILNGRIVTISKEDKILHHIVCVFSANFLVGLLYLSERLAKIIDERRDYRIYLPLIKSVIDNIKCSEEVKDILTGPVVRGDVETIRAHLAFLRKYPKFLRYYKVFSSVLLDMVTDLDRYTYKKLKKLLN